MPLPLRWLHAAVWLVLLPALRADQSPIQVDVVTNLAARGRSLPLPNVEKPVYYLPIPLGREDSGPNKGYYPVQPPSNEQVEHLVEEAMASQYYLLLSTANQPSLVVTIKWGFKSPTVLKTGHTDPNQPALEDLVSGGSVSFKAIQGATDPKSQELKEMTRHARWYVQIAAIDYAAWALPHRSVELWRENVSADLRGRNLGDVLPTLLKTGGYFVGREIVGPALIRAPIRILPGWSYTGRGVAVPHEEIKTHKTNFDY